jgi:signal transduction histidine kinase
VKKAVDALQMDIKSSNALVINEIDPETKIISNSAYLDSIILNFLSNAIKYAQPGRAPIVRLKAEADEKQIILTVNDNGRGIDLAKYGEELFGMYKTFHGNDDAKGIGLYLVKLQIDALGGSIEVESEVGTGSTFRIHLPIINSVSALN